VGSDFGIISSKSLGRDKVTISKRGVCGGGNLVEIFSNTSTPRFYLNRRAIARGIGKHVLRRGKREERDKTK